MSRIGPKLALAMLSKLSVTQVITAVAEGDAKALEAVPGIGAQASKKLLLELRPKLDKLAATGLLVESAVRSGASQSDWLSGPKNKPWILAVSLRKDLRLALIGLGYKAREIDATIDKLQTELSQSDRPRDGVELNLATLIKMALSRLSGRVDDPNQPSLDELF